MEGNCGMQVTGFIIIHNNNIGCICTNVSALKRCQNIFPTFPRAFSTYSTELRHLYVSSPIYQATFPNNKKNSKLDAIFFTQTTYVNSSSPSRQWFGWWFWIGTANLFQEVTFFLTFTHWCNKPTWPRHRKPAKLLFVLWWKIINYSGYK